MLLFPNTLISMKNLIFLFIIGHILFSCKTVKISTKKQEPKTTQFVDLSAAEKRKFDYFFYEAQRLKMQGNLQKAKMYLIECLNIDSTSSTCYYELSNIEIRNKNFKGAQQLLENSVRLSPDNKWYKILLGDLYQQNKDFSKAVSIYESLVGIYPNSDEYLYILAQLYYKNKDYENAIDAYNKLENNIGINEAISLEKEKVYLEMGKKSLAYKEIELLIEENPYEPRYYGFLGDLYMYTKEYEKAEISYRKILDIDSTNGLGYFSIANVRLQFKDTVGFFNNFERGLADKELNIEVKLQRLLPFLMSKDFSEQSMEEKVEPLFQSLTTVHNDDSRSFIYYGHYLQTKNKKEKAIDEYKNGIAIDNSDPSVWQDLFLLEIDLGKFELLHEDTKEALLIFPDNPLFNLFFAMAAMQKEDYTNAYKVLKHGFNHVGDNINLKGQYYAYLGDVEYSLNKPDEAFKSYQEALNIDENNVVVLNNYSYYLSVENKNLDKAEKMISKCIELEPGNATYLDTYAWVLFKRGRYFESKYIIERAIDNGGDSNDIIVEHYGDILYKNGDIEGALLQWNKAKDLGSESEILDKKIELKSYVEE
jgi:tetratricopeptide (TPR) repeat protein